MSRHSPEGGLIIEWLAGRRRELRDLISNYVAIDTRSPNEHAAEPFLRNLMRSIGYELVSAGDWERARQHPDWSPHPAAQAENVAWVGRPRSEPDNARPAIVFNAHVDVVPASTDQAIATADDWVSGRGSCDTKANLVMVVEVLRCLQELGRRSRYCVRFHLPTYEEIGGNGTLALILADAQRSRPAGAICLEPTGLFAYTGHRGCLTYHLKIDGRSIHMGSEGAAGDPIRAAANIIVALGGLEAELNKEVCSQPGFGWTRRPLQVTVAQVSGGGWIGSSPESCLLVGNVGVAPGASFEAIEARLEQLGRRVVGDDLILRWSFSTGLRNHPYVSPNLGHLQELVDRSQSGGEHRIWSASCDARHYQRLLDVPAVIFGAGSLASAHTRDERISLLEVEKGAALLAEWLAERSI
jgi:acetylornithine deacetylase